MILMFVFCLFVGYALCNTKVPSITFLINSLPRLISYMDCTHYLMLLHTYRRASYYIFKFFGASWISPPLLLHRKCTRIYVESLLIFLILCYYYGLLCPRPGALGFNGIWSINRESSYSEIFMVLCFLGRNCLFRWCYRGFATTWHCINLMGSITWFTHNIQAHKYQLLRTTWVWHRKLLSIYCFYQAQHAQ